MVTLPKRHQKNCPGPFYVERDECMSCGAPEFQAPDLMSHDETGQCFFVRQPSTPDETNAAIRAVWTGCCGAVRYSGSSPETLTRLAELGLGEQCDQPIPGDPRRIVRNCVFFEYDTPYGAWARRKSLLRILELIVKAVDTLPDGECYAFWCRFKQASFRYRWATEVFDGGCTVRINVAHEHDDTWSLRLSEHEVSHTAFAILIDDELQTNPAFRSLGWFEGGSGPEHWENGRPHPY